MGCKLVLEMLHHAWGGALRRSSHSNLRAGCQGPGVTWRGAQEIHTGEVGLQREGPTFLYVAMQSAEVSGFGDLLGKRKEPFRFCELFRSGQPQSTKEGAVGKWIRLERGCEQKSDRRAYICFVNHGQCVSSEPQLKSDLNDPTEHNRIICQWYFTADGFVIIIFFKSREAQENQ